MRRLQKCIVILLLGSFGSLMYFTELLKIQVKEVHEIENLNKIQRHWNQSYAKEIKLFLENHLNRSRDTFKRCESISTAIDVHQDNIYLAKDLTFCPIYKSATSSWSNILLQIGNKKIYKDNWQGSMRKSFRRLRNIDVNVKAKGTLKFSVVRHPFHRLVSAYRDKFEGGNKKYFYDLHGFQMVVRYRDLHIYTKTEIKNFTRPASLRAKFTKSNPLLNPVGPTFTEYVKYILYSGKEDQHWRNYEKHCSFCTIKYDFILRFENLEEESNYLLRYLNVNKDIRFTKENPTDIGGKKKPDQKYLLCFYFDQLDRLLVEELFKKYENDFYLFQYEKDLDNCEQYLS